MTMADRIVAEALTWQGTPYRHQASLKGFGTDCLGVIRGVYEQVTGRDYEAMPPYTRDWAESGTREHLLLAARRYLIERPWVRGDVFTPGDVLIFRWRRSSACKHCAICVSSEEMLHAAEGLGTQVVTISDCWRKMVAGVFYFPED